MKTRETAHRRAAVIYVRVSTQEQVLNNSLETQERACREYCDREGLEVAEVFIERGESAKTMRRTALIEMLDYCRKWARKKGISTLVVYKVDRLARDTYDHGVIRYDLSKVGVVLRSTQESISETPEGLLMENLMASFAQFDNDTRGRRTREGMLESLRKGRWVYSPPIGYRSAESKEGPSLVLDPERAPLVKQAFELIAHGGLSLAEARDAVTAAGLRARNGGVLTAERFNKMICNPIYYGLVRSEALDFVGPGDFQPIISKDLFELAQHLSGRRKSPAGSNYRLDNPDFPLRRVLRCASCGASITASWSKGRSSRYGYYRCVTRGCGLSAKAGAVTDQFEAFLQNQTVSEPVFSLFGEVILDAWKDRIAAAEQHSRALQKELSSLDAKRSKLLEAMIYRQVIDRAEYDRQESLLDSEADRIRRELVLVQPPVLEIEACVEIGRTLLTDLKGTWNRLSLAQRGPFVQAMYPEGLVYDGSEIRTGANPWYCLSNPKFGDAGASEVPPAGFEPA